MDSQVRPDVLAAHIKLTRQRPGASSFQLDVSLEIPHGITILFGPSGAGKSSILDCIAGLVTPGAGRIAIGLNLLFDAGTGVNLPPRARRVAYVFQTLALFPHMTAEQNVAYGLDGLPNDERRVRVREILELFRAEKLRDRKPGEMSGGERQRVALARSLVTRPRVLLLDEPLTGLDAQLKAGIIEDLRLWNAAHQIPILYVTHNREEVDALGERVIALDHGRVAGEGTPMEVLDAPRRTGLAQAAGFENLFDATVMDLREADGVMRVHLTGSACEIEVPLAYASAGDRVRIAIRPGDILLATVKPERISARNVVEGSIAVIETRGTMVRARVNCGAEFIVHVTHSAARSLELGVGSRVWLVLKTHSCHLVRE